MKPFSLRRLAIAIAVSLASWFACTPALAFDLPELMTLLAQVRHGEAEFTEQRFVRSLDEPLSSSGTLSFDAPDRFTRKTLKPRAESMSVDGNTVTLSRGGRSRSFPLDSTPEMVAVVEAVRGTLTGNVAAVQRFFDTRIEGSRARWQLTLTPLESAAGGQVRRVRIGGAGKDVNRIEMEFAGGDSSVMTITPTVVSNATPPALPASAPVPAR